MAETDDVTSWEMFDVTTLRLAESDFDQPIIEPPVTGEVMNE
jgi:hypothetical protein